METRSRENRPSAISTAWTIGCAVPFLLVVALALSFWYVKIQPYQRHRSTFDRVLDTIVSIADRSPEDVSPEHWDYALGWTVNAMSNCLAVPEWLTDRENGETQFSRFADELEQRAQGRMGPETIEIGRAHV